MGAKRIAVPRRSYVHLQRLAERNLRHKQVTFNYQQGLRIGVGAGVELVRIVNLGIFLQVHICLTIVRAVVPVGYFNCDQEPDRVFSIKHGTRQLGNRIGMRA